MRQCRTKPLVSGRVRQQAIARSSLIRHCHERIAHYKAPKSIDFAQSLPRNASGKLLKRMLRAPYWEGRERQVN